MNPPTALPCAPPQQPSAQPKYGGGVFASQDSLCEAVFSLYEAYIALTTGNVRALVKIADRETRYSRGDEAAILRQLQHLAPLCPAFPIQVLPGRVGWFSPISAFRRRSQFGGF
jgi:hypothetical protein